MFRVKARPQKFSATEVFVIYSPVDIENITAEFLDQSK